MYEKSISFYESALNHKPGDDVATRRIQEIRDLMNDLANRSMYDKLIKSADRSFQKKQYPETLTEYEQLLICCQRRGISAKSDKPDKFHYC